MDGRVGAIRSQLDEEGHSDTADRRLQRQVRLGLLRAVPRGGRVDPEFGDRRGYQMDPANADEAVREAKLDLEEGADVLMVKPALPYLDVVRRVKDETGAPVAAYQVSGEYSMLKAAAANGWIDERAAAMESLTAIRRAGADMIITYYAKDAAPALVGGRRGEPARDGITTATVKPKLRSRGGRGGGPARRDRQAADEPAPVELPARAGALRPDRSRGRAPIRTR